MSERNTKLKEMLKGERGEYLEAIKFLEDTGILDNKEMFQIFTKIVMVANSNGYREGIQFAADDFKSRMKDSKLLSMQEELKSKGYDYEDLK